MITDRGYTGHEHLLGVGLIHMNGRLYDPLLHRFLSPDNYVQDPTNTQNFNRYAYVLNNPLSHVDPSGEFIPFLAAALIGGVLNWATHGAQFSWRGLGYFGVGAAAGALGAGVGSGINVSIAGGSFSAGFMGTATGVGSTGFVAGAATGAAAGFTNGLISGIGNTLVGGGTLGQALRAGFISGLGQGLLGGVTGGLFGGLDALKKDVNFFTGKVKMDLSNGYGAHNISLSNPIINGKYVGKYEGVNVYESSDLGYGYNSGGITLPYRGITVGKGAFSLGLDRELVQHEFGHILQIRDVGVKAFYSVIGKESMISASLDGFMGHVHSNFWTETWANFKSSQYFGAKYLFSNRFPIQDISWVNRFKLTLASSPFWWP